MKIISSVNEKGGVGKTTTTIHIGAALAETHRVLLIDFDPQTNLSQGYKIPEDYRYNSSNFLDGNGSFAISEKSKNLYVLSGNRLLDSKTYDRNILKTRINQLNDAIRDKFDFILIDCPPQPLVEKLDSNKKPIPLLSEMALIASDYIVIPLEADEFSLLGLKNFILGILRVKNLFNPKLQIAGVFLNKVITTENDFKDCKRALERSPVKEYLLDHFVRKDKTVRKAVHEGKSVFQVDPKCRAAFDFRLLCEDILQKMQ